MKQLNLSKFLKAVKKVDDVRLTQFLEETGFAKASTDVIYLNLFKKFTAFMAAESPEEIAETISLEDLANMAGSIGEYGSILAGDGSISYGTVFDRLRSEKSVGRRLI